SAPYVAPFVVFVTLLSLRSVAPIGPMAQEFVFIGVTAALIVWIARPVLDLSTRAPLASILIGVLVFVIWVAPDVLVPGYRHHLENPITGMVKTTFPEIARTSAALLTLRSIRAVVIVPIIEELFWRAWLMRWMISPNFQKVPLGAYAPFSFWTVAV